MEIRWGNCVCGLRMTSMYSGSIDCLLLWHSGAMLCLVRQCILVCDVTTIFSLHSYSTPLPFPHTSVQQTTTTCIGLPRPLSVQWHHQVKAQAGWQRSAAATGCCTGRAAEGSAAGKRSSWRWWWCRRCSNRSSGNYHQHSSQRAASEQRQLAGCAPAAQCLGAGMSLIV